MENWEKDHPDMMEIRVYYFYKEYMKYDSDTGKWIEYEITEEEFKEYYEEMTGESYDEFKSGLWGVD